MQYRQQYITMLTVVKFNKRVSILLNIILDNTNSQISYLYLECTLSNRTSHLVRLYYKQYFVLAQIVLQSVI